MSLKAAEQIIHRVEAAGCPVIALTVDNTTGRNSETFLRTRPKDLRQCTACHEGAAGPSTRERPMYDGINMTGVRNTNPAMDWAFADRLRKFWKGKFFIKGIDTREDYDAFVARRRASGAALLLRPSSARAPARAPTPGRTSCRRAAARGTAGAAGGTIGAGGVGVDMAVRASVNGSSSATDGGVSNSPGAAIDPSIAVGIPGQYVAWADSRTGTSQIYVSLHTALGWQELAGSAHAGEQQQFARTRAFRVDRAYVCHPGQCG
jgi:hypothetical protein